MQSVIQKVEEKFKKKQVVDVHSGDTVKVHQKIKEGSKERVQIFQGLVIRVDRKSSHTSRIVVRRISSGVGVEKSFLIHSPLVTKIEVTKRSKVRRNYLTYMRERTGKSARLSNVDFDREGVNTVVDEKAEEEEKKLHEENKESHDADVAEQAEEVAKEEAKAEKAQAAHDEAKADDDKSTPTKD